MQGQKICSKQAWWTTGNTDRASTKDHLDMWTPKLQTTEQVPAGPLRRALQAMDQTAVSELLAWHTVHGGQEEHYFEAGQAARLREEPGTV
eukprot:2365856-Rhodomonas_salina.1